MFNARLSPNSYLRTICANVEQKVKLTIRYRLLLTTTPCTVDGQIIQTPIHELKGTGKGTGRELGKRKGTGKTQHFVHAEEKELEKHGIFNRARERELEKHIIFNHAQEREQQQQQKQQEQEEEEQQQEQGQKQVGRTNTDVK